MSPSIQRSIAYLTVNATQNPGQHNLQRTWLELIQALLTIFVFSMPLSGWAAGTATCGAVAGPGNCFRSDYTNFGLASNNDATSIEYDNYISSFHGAGARRSDGSFVVWGEQTAPDGSSSNFAPVKVDASSYLGLTGTVLKMGMAGGSSQLIALTSDGLFVWGAEDTVVSTDLTSNREVQALRPTNGDLNTGLPSGVSPGNVKMMFVAENVIAITTCAGEVWVLSRDSAAMLGNGATGTVTSTARKEWTQVQTATGPLTDVVATRGSPKLLMALKSDGTMWVWGNTAYLGDNTTDGTFAYATQMTLPTSISSTVKIKMFGASGNSEYALLTNGELWALGGNGSKALGLWSSTNSKVWVQPHYDSATGPVMNDIAWISPQEHYNTQASINVINQAGDLWAWGYNDGQYATLGLSGTYVDPTRPQSSELDTPVTSVESAGHTSLITAECKSTFGYVGHKTGGSIGNGDTGSSLLNQYTFLTSAVPVCGTTPRSVDIEIASSLSYPFCPGAVADLEGTPGGGSFALPNSTSTPPVQNNTNATLAGKTLTINLPGSVIVRYTLPDAYKGSCPTAPFVDAAVTATTCPTNTFSLSGTVFRDDGGTSGTGSDGEKNGDETGFDPGSLSIVILDGAGAVLGIAPVADNGQWSVRVPSGNGYSAYLTTTPPTVGATGITATVSTPSGWGPTNENVAGAVDTTGDGLITSIDATAARIIDFGLIQQGDQPMVAVNDADTYTLDTAKTVAVLANDVGGDPADPTSVVFTVTGNPGTPTNDGKTLIVANQGTWTIDPATGDITFTPLPGYNGNPDPVTYQVADTDGDTDTATVTLTANKFAKCGAVAGTGNCSKTDYSNFGIKSTNDATSIEYDNFVSSFHGAAARRADGSFVIWGEDTAWNGASNLVPVIINSANFPGLNGKVLKVGLAGNNSQVVALTTNGLYVWGAETYVVDDRLTTSDNLQPLRPVNGQLDTGLPEGVTPENVKMMFVAEYGVLAITTCDGHVWVLSNSYGYDQMNGQGEDTDINYGSWYQVKTDADTPLTDVVATRGSPLQLMALKADGTLWVWGRYTYLGDGTSSDPRYYATQMQLPSVVGTTANNETVKIKMFGATVKSSYVLLTNGQLWSLGDNTNKVLGDWTTNESKVWVQPRYGSASGSFLNDIAWISPQEGFPDKGGISVINKSGALYAWGTDDEGMLGLGETTPGGPTRVTSTDLGSSPVTAVESGGHTTMITAECKSTFGYTGHKIEGSMGDGIGSQSSVTAYTFQTAAVPVCGTTEVGADIDLQASLSAYPFCPGATAQLTGSPTGGTFSLPTAQSNPPVPNNGNATLSGDILTVNAPGNVVVRYTLASPQGNCPQPAFADTAITVPTCPTAPLVTLSGNVFKDNGAGSSSGNGLINTGETGVDPGNVSVVILDSTGKVVWIAAVAEDGTWSTQVASGTGYSAYLSTTPPALGATGITAAVNLPEGWSTTNENVGGTVDTAGNGVINFDATVNSTIDFGLEEAPAASDPEPTVPDVNATYVAVPVTGNVATNDPLPGAYQTPTGAPASSPAGSTATLTVQPDGSYSFTGSHPGIYVYQVPVCPAGQTAGCPTETLTITVLDPATALDSPTANTDIAQTLINQPVILATLANDRPGEGGTSLNPASVTVKTQPGHGTTQVDPATGNITYTPAAGYTGEDSYTYEVCDSANPARCTTAVQIITILPQGAPNSTLGADDYASTAYNTPVSGSVLTNDTDAQGDAQSVTAQTTSVPNKGTLVLNGDGTYTFTPVSGFSGPINFPYEVCDDQGACAQATLYILVDEAPEVVLPVTREDVNATYVAVPVTGNVATNDPLPGAYQTPTGAPASSPAGSTATLTVQPDGSYSFTGSLPGVYVYQIPVCPAGLSSGCPTETLTITVLDPATALDSPTANTDIAQTLINQPVILATLANDRPGEGGTSLNPATVKVTSTPGHGTTQVDPATGNITYTPAAGYTGEDSYTYEVCDSANPARCTTAVQIITILPQGAPNSTLGADDYASTAYNTPVSGSVLTNDTDAQGDAQSVTAQTTSVPNKGTLVLNGDGTYTFTPVSGFSGPINFPYEVCDNGSPKACAEATLYILVAPPAGYVAPVTKEDVNATYVNVPVTGGVATNDPVPGTTYQTPTGPSSQPAGSSASLTVNPDGSYSFTGSLPGVYVYQIPVCPAGLSSGCPTETLTITVLDPATALDSPTANTDIAQTLINQPVILATLANDFSGESGFSLNPASVRVTSNPGHGTTVVDPATGNITFTPATGFTGEVSYTYEVCDTANPARCMTAVQIITILPADSPNSTLGADDYASTAYNTPVAGSVMTNDTDAQKDTQRVTPQTATIPGKGTLVLRADGSYTFTPVNGFSGPINFPYEVCDNQGACAQATLYILVGAQAGNVKPQPIPTLNEWAQIVMMLMMLAMGAYGRAQRR